MRYADETTEHDKNPVIYTTISWSIVVTHQFKDGDSDDHALGDTCDFCEQDSYYITFPKPKPDADK